jgi:hypothetical protein
MLFQGSRTVLRSVSGLPLPFKPPRYGLNIGPIKCQIHVRLRRATSITPLIGIRGPQITLRRPLNGITYNSVRYLSTTRVIRKDSQINESASKPEESRSDTDEASLEYKRTEKGEAAKEVDLSARLKDRRSETEKGEVIRLLKLAAREWRTLSGKLLDIQLLTSSRNSSPLYFFWCSNVNPLLHRQNHRHSDF